MMRQRLSRRRHVGRIKFKRLCTCDELIELGLRHRGRRYEGQKKHTY
jgi:hypothetical protein